jgi:hypothetical protein
VTADGVHLSATMKDVGGDATHRLGAKATSGASGGDVGVAGSFALNVSTTSTQAVLQDGSVVTAGAGAVSLTAASTSESLVEAKAEASGGGSVGVGASFAINVVDNGTLAALEDNATLSGGGDVTLSATGSHEYSTQAASGGKAPGGVGVGGSFAITVADNLTTATLGSGGALNISGVLSATATHHGQTTTKADGTALGADAAVGAAIA